MAEHDPFASPLRKLVNFFKKSRDRWKEKYMAVKKENKKLINKVCFLKSSQQKWKNEALLLRKQLRQAAIDPGGVPLEPEKKRFDGPRPALRRNQNPPSQLFCNDCPPHAATGVECCRQPSG
jgi:hypothetical protein